MKSTILLLAGVSLGLGWMLLSGQSKRKIGGPAADDVDALAHKLEDAWADHHTVA